MLTVVNVGGPLARSTGDDALATLCRALGEAAAEHPIIIVPGGGRFADTVRDAGRRFGLRGPTTERMTLLAMDQFGCLLGDLIPDAVLCRSVTRAREEAESGHAAVLLPAEQLIGEEVLTGSWAVTSDSIALWVAGVTGGARTLLLKPADGVFAEWPTDREPPPMRVSELASLHPSVEGGDMSSALEAAGVDAWVVSGRDPDRLLDLLRVDGPAATSVVRSAAERGADPRPRT